jgi:hypothetical protein
MLLLISCVPAWHERFAQVYGVAGNGYAAQASLTLPRNTTGTPPCKHNWRARTAFSKCHVYLSTVSLNHATYFHGRLSLFLVPGAAYESRPRS